MIDEPKRERGRPGKWILIVGVAACAIAGVLGWRFVQLQRTAESAAGEVRWIMPEMRRMKTQVNATGTVRIKTGAEVRVGAQLSGIVRRLFVTVGSPVRQGEVIAEIDSRSIEAKLQQARAQLAQSRVAMSKAAVDEGRSERLYAAGVISKQQFQDSKASLDAATASVEVAKSGVEDASVDLAYVTIRAPIRGIVASVSTQQGETVAASFATPTFVTIIQRDALELVALVDEADIGNVHAGEAAAFTTETWPDREFTGTVLRVSPVATILSGVVNYEVTIAIRKADVVKLRPDMTANVNISTSERKALSIPSECLQKDAEGTFVSIRSTSGQPARRAVTVGARNGGTVEILSGLDPNTAVLQVSGGAQK
jgi:RND family efflux transporter MFP subunit